jgi:RHS repeat-associated protein
MGIGNLLLEADNNGNATNYYIYGNSLIARRTSGGTYSFYHSDFRGSVVAITDASQNITHKYQYDAFGAVLDKTEANPNPFHFVGKYGVIYEGDSLSYMRARWYDASMGRFLSEDPKWDKNLYLYSNNNPIMKKDITGLSPTPISSLYGAGYNSIPISEVKKKYSHVRPTDKYSEQIIKKSVVQTYFDMIGARFIYDAVRTPTKIDLEYTKDFIKEAVRDQVISTFIGNIPFVANPGVLLFNNAIQNIVSDIEKIEDPFLKVEAYNWFISNMTNSKF